MNRIETNEACEILSLSRHKLMKLVALGKIKVSRPIPNGRMYFSRKAVEAYQRQLEKELAS